MLNPIALAIPVFFVAMGAELALSWRRGRLSGERPAWRLVDAVVAAGLYVAVYDAAALFVLPGDNPWVWLGAFVGVDFFYYWWHRASHCVNVLWAAHVVHHQSEDDNLAVALRQAPTSCAPPSTRSPSSRGCPLRFRAGPASGWGSRRRSGGRRRWAGRW